MAKPAPTTPLTNLRFAEICNAHLPAGVVLHRLTDGKAPPAPPLDAPQALRLTRKPMANVERYDDLRDKGQRHAS